MLQNKEVLKQINKKDEMVTKGYKSLSEKCSRWPSWSNLSNNSLSVGL
jgi:hypothetical protein